MIYDPDIEEHLDLCSTFVDFNREKMKKAAADTISFYKGKLPSPGRLRRLEDRWYDSLKRGDPDWDVYGDAYYLIAELWACWRIYSRKTIGLLSKEIPGGRSIDSMVKMDLIENEGGCVVDLGCGLGYTTASLKVTFPEADVFGTNLKRTLQWNAATEVGRRRGFRLRSSPTKIKGHIALLLASEYFEHFQRPVEHLMEVFRSLNPSIMVIANSFGSKSIGHFDEYVHSGRRIKGSEVGRIFGGAMRREGYSLLETGFWNNRPQVWMKKESQNHGFLR